MTDTTIHSRRRARFSARRLFLAVLLVPAALMADIPVYETFELRVERPNVPGDLFRTFAEVTFRNGPDSYTIDGFYDGDDTWRARFLPTRPGKWTYTWKLHESSGSGSFVAIEKANPRNHGPLTVTRGDPARLVFADGSAYYAFGGKRFSANNYGPAQKRRGVIRDTEVNPEVLTLDQLGNYLDAMVANGMNTAYLQVSLFPLDDSKYKWDLEWIRRGERFVREMGRRGIYCQVNFFSALARHKDTYFASSPSGEDHPFNAWDPEDNEAAQNYIRTIIARFGGYYNVYWELGDEVASRYDKPGNHRTFQNLANGQYLPTIRHYDPFNRPVGCSFLRSKRGDMRDRSGDRYVQGYDIDIWFPHDEGELERWKEWGVPLIVNAPDSFEGGSGLGLDPAIRDPDNLFRYRAALWLSLLAGADGCFNGSWLNISRKFGDTVETQFGYQKSLRNFIARLPEPYFGLQPVEGPVTRGPAAVDKPTANPNARLGGKPQATTRHTSAAAGDTLTLTYFRGETEAGDIELDLEAGTYTASWVDPSTGGVIEETSLLSDGGKEPAVLAHPAWPEDCLLMLVRGEDAAETPEESAEDAS